MYEFMYENGLHFWLSGKFFNCVFQAVELKLFSHQNYSLSLASDLIVSGFGSHNLVFLQICQKKMDFYQNVRKFYGIWRLFRQFFTRFVHSYINSLISVFSVYIVHEFFQTGLMYMYFRTWFEIRGYGRICLAYA